MISRSIGNSNDLNTINRGEIYWVELDPTRGSEISKTRPCVVLSAVEINQYRNTANNHCLTRRTAPAGSHAIRRRIKQSTY
jgi:mRNA-degrading endonuclease toxin of MazEF toxin-antitoxin module